MTRGRPAPAWLAALAISCALAFARAQGASTPEIDAARAELESARFDKALALLDALLGRSGLEPDAVAEALALRAQARVATGDLGRAEQDWKRLLLLRPAYEPDVATTGRKARERFDRVAATVVGTLKLEVDPPEARILVDGRGVAPAADGTVRLAAGERRIQVDHPGFDAADLAAVVLAGDVVPVRVRLVPNARSVVLRTEPDGVEVRLDGSLVGVSARPEGAEGSQGPASARAARLVVADLPLGEHVFELAKPCYRTTRVRVQVQVDVADRGAIFLETVALDPARAVVAIHGTPAGAEVQVDGAVVGRLPVEGAALCAGEHTVEVRSGGRIVWSDEVEFPEQGAVTVDVSPRPRAIVLGAAVWPASLAEIDRRFGAEVRAALPPNVDLTRPAGWATVPLPRDTDLAAAVLPPESVGSVGRIVVFSPILRTVETLDAPPRSAERPASRTPSLGWRLADAAGGVVVAEVVPGGPAAAAGILPGVRVTTLVGRVSESAAQVRGVVASLPIASEATLEFLVPGEVAPKGASLRVAGSPELLPRPNGPASRAIAAAWAAVDAAGGEDTAFAAARLGALLLEAGNPEAAAEALALAELGARAGVGGGTIAYLRGRALALAGRDAEARAAFAKARETAARAGTDDGPAIAPAAVDHAADLGVSAP